LLYCGRRAPRRMQATGLPATQASLRRRAFCAEAKPLHRFYIVGGAPRGECRPQACQRPKHHSEGGPSAQKPSLCIASILWEARPRGERRPQACQRPKHHSEGGPSAQKPSLCIASIVWEARPAANAGHRPASDPSITPKASLLRRSQASASLLYCRRRAPRRMQATGLPATQASLRRRTFCAEAKPLHRSYIVGGAPRGECRPQACQRPRHHSEGGPSAQKPSLCIASILWEARPAANAGRRPARLQMGFSPTPTSNIKPTPQPPRSTLQNLTQTSRLFKL